MGLKICFSKISPAKFSMIPARFPIKPIFTFLPFTFLLFPFLNFVPMPRYSFKNTFLLIICLLTCSSICLSRGSLATPKIWHDTLAMQITSEEVFHPDTPLGIGAKDEGLVRINIKTIGSTSPIKISRFTFSVVQNSDAVLLKHVAFYDCSHAALPDAISCQKNETVTVSQDSITVDGMFTLVEGDNYFWLKADISDYASEGNSYKVSPVSYTMENGTTRKLKSEGDSLRTIILNHQVLFSGGMHGSRTWRIPAIVAKGSSVIAVADARISYNTDLPNNIDLVARISNDAGTSWSDPVTIADFGDAGASDPAVVVDKNTGDILCLFASYRGLFQSTPDNRIRIQLIRSSDSGQTWSEPVDISDQVYRPDWHAAWIASGSAHQLSDGTIVAVAGVRKTAGYAISNYMIFSKDGGYIWSVAPGEAYDNGDEAKVVSLEDKRLMMLIRSKGMRKVNYSSDMGQSWGSPVPVPELVEPGVNGDVLRYSSVSGDRDTNRILFSIASHPSERRNLSVFVSYDEGRTWPVQKVIFRGPAAYSALCRLDDGSIGLLYENGNYEIYQLCFARFSLSWLTDGKDRLSR